VSSCTTTNQMARTQSGGIRPPIAGSEVASGFSLSQERLRGPDQPCTLATWDTND